MHAIRDRIQISESFDLISQLPLILKGIYVDQWKYSSSPKNFQTVEEMKNEVKRSQAQLGEQDFDWKISTEEIISRTVNSLKVYFSKGQMDHIRAQLPADLKNLV